MKENWRIYNRSYREIQEKLHIAPLLAKLVANRCTPESAAEFLDKEGKLADLAVVDRNLFAADASEIKDASVVLTVMDGKTVYSGI